MKKVLTVLALLLFVCVSVSMGHTRDDPFVTDMVAGGGNEASAIDVGDVRIWNDTDYLYVDYVLGDDQPDWCITQIHLKVATSLEGIPQTKKGNPIPGKFDYISDYECTRDPEPIKVPLEWGPETELFIAAHAVVSTPVECEATGIVYGTERGDGTVGSGGVIYSVDVVTKAATFVYSTGLNPGNRNSPNGNAFDAVNYRLYYSSNDRENTPSILYFYDFDAQHLAGMLNGFAAGAAFYNQEYYYVENRTDDLRAASFNEDGTVLSDDLVLADFTGTEGKGLRFGDIVISTEGILYGSAQVVINGTATGNEFFSINLATGEYQIIKSFSLSEGTKQLAFGSNGVLYAHNAGTGEFFTVNLAYDPADPTSELFTFIGIVTGSSTGQFTDLASGPLCIPETETAWGAGLDFLGKNWATYFNYTVQLDWPAPTMLLLTTAP